MLQDQSTICRNAGYTPEVLSTAEVCDSPCRGSVFICRARGRVRSLYLGTIAYTYVLYGEVGYNT